jgi:hypothetical protein
MIGPSEKRTFGASAQKTHGRRRTVSQYIIFCMAGAAYCVMIIKSGA